MCSHEYELTMNSHCPWVDNCVGVNNHKHFMLYVFFMIAGIALLIRLTLDCEWAESFPCLPAILTFYQMSRFYQHHSMPTA